MVKYNVGLEDLKDFRLIGGFALIAFLFLVAWFVLPAVLIQQLITKNLLIVFLLTVTASFVLVMGAWRWSFSLVESVFGLNQLDDNRVFVAYGLTIAWPLFVLPIRAYRGYKTIYITG